MLLAQKKTNVRKEYCSQWGYTLQFLLLELWFGYGMHLLKLIFVILLECLEPWSFESYGNLHWHVTITYSKSVIGKYCWNGLHNLKRGQRNDDEWPVRNMDIIDFIISHNWASIVSSMKTILRLCFPLHFHYIFPLHFSITLSLHFHCISIAHFHCISIAFL